MSTSSQASAPRTLTAARIGWIVLALFWATFTVFECVKYDVWAGLSALVFFIAPDLTMLKGARQSGTLERGQLAPRAVPLYNLVHRSWIPLALFTAYAFSPLPHWAPVVTGLLAWLTHIAIDRAAGYGLRDKNGFQRG